MVVILNTSSLKIKTLEMVCSGRFTRRRACRFVPLFRCYSRKLAIALGARRFYEVRLKGPNCLISIESLKIKCRETFYSGSQMEAIQFDLSLFRREALNLTPQRYKGWGWGLDLYCSQQRSAIYLDISLL